MWQHQNNVNVLYKNNESIHPMMKEALQAEITLQWEEGHWTLPARYSNLFQGTFNSKLQTDPFQQ